jgi:hypothetical protein
MRSKKDPETVVIVVGSPDRVARIIADNSDKWEELKEPELNRAIADLAAHNRAERRGGIRCPVDRGPCDREIKACCSCRRNRKNG